MFTHSCQLSMLILFHCIIHVSLFLFLAFFLCVWKTLRKIQKISCSIKRKPKNISHSSFACWELSRVNSFSHSCFTFFRKTKTPKTFQFFSSKFLFLSLGREEKTTMKMMSGSHMHYCWSNKEPILPCLLLWINVCRFQLSPMHVHYYYYPHRSVMQVKGNNDNIWWNDWDEEKLVWTRLILLL